MSSWDPKAGHVLPECMQYAFGKIMESYEIIDNELAPEEKYRMTYLRNFVSDLLPCVCHVLIFLKNTILK